MKKKINQLGLSKIVESLVVPNTDKVLNLLDDEHTSRDKNECALVFREKEDIGIFPLSPQNWSRYPQLVYQSVVDFSPLDGMKYHRPFNVDAVHQSRTTKRFLLQEHKLGFWESSKLVNLLGDRGGVAPFLRENYKNGNGVCYITFDLVFDQHIPKMIVLFDPFIPGGEYKYSSFVHEGDSYYYVIQPCFSWEDLRKVLGLWDQWK